MFTRIFALSLYLLAFGAGLSVARAQQEVDRATLARLAAVWEGRSREVISARLTLRKLSRAPMGSPPSREDCATFVQSLGPRLDEQDVRRSIEFFNLGIQPESEPWSTYFYLFDGQRLRQDRWYDGQQLSSTVRYADGVTVTTQLRNKQVDILPVNNRQGIRWNLNDFRFTPTADLLAEFNALRLSDTIIRLSGKTRELDVELDDAWVRRSLVGDPARSARETFFGEPIGTDDGILFPRWICSLRYSNSEVENVELLAIEESEFNGSFDDREFQVGAEPGFVVWDHRGTMTRPEPHSISTAIPDVFAVADHRADDAWFKRSAPPTTQRKSFVTVLTVLCIVGIAIFAVMKRAMDKTK